MKEDIDIWSRFFMNKYAIIYIFITSIFAYCILNYMFKNQDTKIVLFFRIYYITLSIVLLILLKQVKNIYEEYVSKIIVIFFSLMMFTSIIGFIISTNKKDILSLYNIYIYLSMGSILFIETFACYLLSEYYLRNKQLKKILYRTLPFIFISMTLIYYSNKISTLIQIAYLAIEATLFIKVIFNIRKSTKLKEQKLNIIKTYICSTILIVITSLYGFYTKNIESTNMLIEIIHLINFTIAWNIVIVKIINEPFKNLSNSLNEKNKELDKLNHKILTRNRELESSINLLKSKEYLDYTFFRFMPHPIIILNSDNDRILFVNKQFLKFAGMTKKRNIINRKINEYIEFMSTDIENRDYNAIFRIENRIKYIETKFLPTYDDVTKKLILIKDNTSKVQTEEIRKEVEKKKIEENIRTEFLSSISHDLKTPINVIYSAMQVEKIYIYKQDFEVLKKYNDISKQNCISLIKLTNNLIDNSKINSQFLVPRLENLNVVEVIEDNVMSLVDYVKWHNIDLIFDTNTEECYLNIDHEFMDRIILNLVSNAVKFTPSEGKIYVIIQGSNDKANILVKDSGYGIKEEFIDKAFNRYSVGENCDTDSKSGTGIGLCIVKQLVELQGGSIEIWRNDDIGTTIRMEFKRGAIKHV